MMRRSLPCLLLAVGVVCLPLTSSAQRAASLAAGYWMDVRPRYSGERARETVAFLDQFVRWPGNRGFDASIAHIVERLERAGYVLESGAKPSDRLIYRVERYPMSNPAWEPLDAMLSVVGVADPVLRFATNRNMLATNSFATPSVGVEAELVDVGDGSPAQLAGVDVRGKVVLARAGIGRVFTEAMKRGAVGVLAYALPAYLQPEKNRTSIQFAGIPLDTTNKAWGIVLSHAAHEQLRTALAKGPVRVKAMTSVRWTPNAIEQAVVAEVRGSRLPAERFVFSAHVQEPGANDNASGVGAQVEMARVAAELLKAGRIDPARTITMLWGLEIRSTERYITQDSVRARGIKWGLSLDMVGEDTKKTGGTFLIEKMPDPSAIWTRGDDKHSEWGGSPITKAQLTPHYFNDFVLARCLEQSATNGWVVKTNPFEGGSDHTPFLRAGKPGLLFWHFTDQFYHTDRDRIDMVSAAELRNVGMSALVSALALTSARPDVAAAITGEVERAAMARLRTETALGVADVAKGGDAALQQDILETWAKWYHDALATVNDVEPNGPSAATQAAIAGAQGRVAAALEGAVASLRKAARP